MIRRASHHLLALGSLLVVVACSAPATDELLRDARKALAAGETRTAEIHTKNVLQRDPGNSAARALLGEISLSRGDFPAAEQSLRKALELGADPAVVQVPLVRALLGQGRFDEVVKQSESGPELAGAERIQLLSLRAAAERALGSFENAERSYRSALEIDPRSAPIRTELASLMLAANRTNAARELADAVLAGEPEFLPAWLVRGNIELAQGRYEAAATAFGKAAEIAKTRGQEHSQEYSIAISQLIETQLAQHKTEDAAANADALLALNAKNATARYLKARVEAEQGNLGGAESRLEAVVADAPNYYPAFALLGRIKAAQNKPEQAMQHLRTALASNQSDNASRVLLAELYIRAGNVDAAKRLFADDSRAPGDALLLAQAGRMSQQAGRPDVAELFFQQSEQQKPSDIRALTGLSNIYVAAGEFERAIRVIEGTSLEQRDSEVLKDYLLTLVQLRQGDLKAAGATAKRLAERQPDSAWSLNLRGTVAVLSRDSAGARTFYSRALELEPRNTTTLINLARIATTSNDEKLAEEYLRRAVAINPSEPVATLGLAQLAAAHKDYPAALSWLGRAPESPARFELEGAVHVAENRFDLAASAFAKAYELAPGLELATQFYTATRRAGQPGADAKLDAWLRTHPNDATAHFAAGSLALGRGEQDAAIKHYEAVLKIDAANAGALNNLAWLYGERGDARAVEYAERAYKAHPKNSSIADTLGWLYVRRGDKKQGLPLLEQAAVGLPEDPNVRYHWAVALEETGDSSKAADTLQKLLANGVEFSGRADASRRLKALQAAGN